MHFIFIFSIHVTTHFSVIQTVIAILCSTLPSRVASTKAVFSDLSSGLPTRNFIHSGFIYHFTCLLRSQCILPDVFDLYVFVSVE